MMKNDFHFMLKALFLLEIFTFLSRLFCYVDKQLDEKLRSIPKFMTSQTGQQIITIHILSNILTSKRNQTMKYDQLIEYKMRNNYLEKPNSK